VRSPEAKCEVQEILNLNEIVKALKLKVLCGEGKLNTEVGGGYVGDLLSDVMAHSKEGDVWITRQIHQNIVAVSSLKDHAAIILVQGSEPTSETLEKAGQENIPILVSNLPSFETIGEIYELLKIKGGDSASKG
jgi:predicted transcriptional regulator